MAKLTLTDISSGYNALVKHNENNTLIEAAIENTLSRDGTAPNTMGASLDMNSNKIVNVTDPTGAQDAATKKYVDDTATAGAGGGITSLLQDSTPQLGGALDANSHDIDITDGKQASFVSADGFSTGYIEMDNINGFEWVSSGNSYFYGGIRDFYFRQTSLSSDARVRIMGSDAGEITSYTWDGITVDSGTVDPYTISGAVAVKLGNYEFDTDQTVGSGQDDYVLTYDNTSGQISLEANSGGDRQIKYKSSDKSLTSNTTLEDDSDLSGMTVETGGYYAITGMLYYDQNGGDIKFSFSYTTSTNNRMYMAHAVAEDGTVDSDCDDGGLDVIIDGLTDAQTGSISITGTVYISGGSDGTMNFKWAQNTSSANATTVKQGSWLRIEKMN